MFYGSIVALITPFKEGHLDLKALERLVEWHVNQGTHGIVACGSTGESFCLSREEHQTVLETCVRVAAGRIPVLAGTGCMTTAETIDLTAQAKKAGVAGALIVTPPYLKPTQQALFEHYKSIHDAVDIPVLLYNNPGRAAVTLSQDTIVKLSALPRIVGIKDSTGDLSRVTELTARVPLEFVQICGEDALTVAFLAQGGRGMISVVANVAPRLSADLYEAWAAGKTEKVATLRDLLAPLCRVLFCESNPIPVKYAVSRLGLCLNELRRPLLPASPEAASAVDRVLESLGLLTPLKSMSHG